LVRFINQQGLDVKPLLIILQKIFAPNVIVLGYRQALR